MRSNHFLGPTVAFSAMALATVLVGGNVTAGVAAPASAPQAAVSEKRTQGCGTGVVELS